ncbi:MAG: hypothetical protein ACK4Z7_05130 [Novosphingobium sp.]
MTVEISRPSPSAGHHLGASSPRHASMPGARNRMSETVKKLFRNGGIGLAGPVPNGTKTLILLASRVEP